jgi:hypothetical protein
MEGCRITFDTVHLQSSTNTHYPAADDSVPTQSSRYTGCTPSWCGGQGEDIGSRMSTSSGAGLEPAPTVRCRILSASPQRAWPQTTVGTEHCHCYARCGARFAFRSHLFAPLLGRVKTVKSSIWCVRPFRVSRFWSYSPMTIVHPRSYRQPLWVPWVRGPLARVG